MAKISKPKKNAYPPDAWEREVRQIAMELSHLHRQVLRSKSEAYYRLVDSKLRVIKLHLTLEQTLERLKIFTNKDFLLMPRDSAMIKWARVFVSKMLRFFRADHELKCKLLWINLLNARLSGQLTPNENNGAKAQEMLGNMTSELMDLPVRYKTLRKTEKDLLEAIEVRSRTIAGLRMKYHEYEVEVANGQALTSLDARLGTNLDNARASPMIKSLGNMLMLAAAPIRDPAQYRTFAETLALEEAEQDKLLELLRRLGELEGIAEPGVKDQKRDELKQALEQKMAIVRTLEQDVLKAYRSLTSPHVPQQHPIIVQSSPKKVTNSEGDFGFQRTQPMNQ